jgi:hypothetical protein
MGKRVQHFGMDQYNMCKMACKVYRIEMDDVWKFVGCYGVVQGLCEFGISVNNILLKVQKNSKNKQPQNLSFIFF